jgi:hypothetical protein
MGEHIMETYLLLIFILGITGIGILWVLTTLHRECKSRSKEQSIVNFLAEEIKKLRTDVNDLKR